MREKDKVLKSVLREKADKYMSLNNTGAVEREEVNFGKNSMFFEKIMEDGNIFNPYIHRRFLPYQYIEMLKYSQLYDISMLDCFMGKTGNKHFDKKYDYWYYEDFLRSEIKKLAVLEKYDYPAYLERSVFWDFNEVKHHLISHYEEWQDELMRRAYSYPYYFQKEIYYRNSRIRINAITIQTSLTDPTKNVEDKVDIKESVRQGFKLGLKLLEKAKNYTRLKFAIDNLESLYDKTTEKNFFRRSFVPPLENWLVKSYWSEGHYYTLKHCAMFDADFVYYGKKSNEACDLLARHLLDGKDFSEESCEWLVNSNLYAKFL